MKSWAGVKDAAEVVVAKKSNRLRKWIGISLVAAFAVVGMSVAFAPPETSTTAKGGPVAQGSDVAQVCDLARSTLKALRTGAPTDSGALVDATSAAILSSEGYSESMLRALDRVHDAAYRGDALGFAVRDLVEECRS